MYHWISLKQQHTKGCFVLYKEIFVTPNTLAKTIKIVAWVDIEYSLLTPILNNYENLKILRDLFFNPPPITPPTIAVRPLIKLHSHIGNTKYAADVPINSFLYDNDCFDEDHDTIVNVKTVWHSFTIFPFPQFPQIAHSPLELVRWSKQVVLWDVSYNLNILPNNKYQQIL